MSGFHSEETGRDVARYFGLTLRETGPDPQGAAGLLGTVTDLDHVRAADGSITTGALLALTDSVGGLCSGLAAASGLDRVDQPDAANDSRPRPGERCDSTRVSSERAVPRSSLRSP